MNQTEICNLALNKLGSPTIVSIDDETKNARACKNYWEQTRDEVLESHPWRCAIKRDRLALEDAEPEYEYSYAFTLPNDCLRVLEMYPDEEYRIEGESLLSDSDECYIKYISRVTNTTKFNPLLVKAIATLLALNISYHISHNVALVNSLRQEYEWILQRAKNVDALGSQEQEDKNTDWVDAGR